MDDQTKKDEHLKTNEPESVDKANEPVDDPLECGYLVGINQEGKPVFEVVGSNPSLATLLGLNQLAAFKLQSNLEAATDMGWPLVAKKLSELTNLLSEKFSK